MYARRAHTTARVMEDCPCTPNDETYRRELWEEIPGFYNNRMTDEEFEIFSRLDGGVRVGSLGPSEEYYTQSDHPARYFNDEDLYQHSEEEEYDYPRGVEDEDEDEEYVWSDEFDEYFDDYTEVWPSSRDDGVHELSLGPEEQARNTRYFDATDLYDRGEPDNQWGKESSRDYRGRMAGEVVSKQEEAQNKEAMKEWLGRWPRTLCEDQSPAAKRRHDLGAGASHIRSHSLHRNRAQSG